MSFNLDDPLAGILSDGSDDSFFDDDILGKKKPTNKKDTPIAEKRNALFDIGSAEKPKSTDVTITNTKKSELNQDILKSEELKFSNKNPSPAAFRKTGLKDTVQTKQSDKIDIIHSPDKKLKDYSTKQVDSFIEQKVDSKRAATKPLERGQSSQSLLDDILGAPLVKPGSLQNLKPSQSQKTNQEFDLDSFLGNTQPKQTVSSKNIPTKQIDKKENVKKDKEIKKTKPGDDWLGIFKDEDKVMDDDELGMPAWLGGGDNKKKSVAEKVNQDNVIKEDDVKTQNLIANAPQVPNVEQITNIPSAISQGVVNNNDLTAESAALHLKQQESQLMVALQLKSQEEKLAAMQLRQKESDRVQRDHAHAHHTQVEDMLRRQAVQRNEMQAVIAAHQERIAQRIKALLLPATDIDMIESTEATLNTQKIDSPHSKEKKQLLQLVQSLQENHDKEIDLMETSYRRQIAFIELAFSQSEERMKEESDKLEKFYSEKISWMEEHHQAYKSLTVENLNILTERHKTENEMLQERHFENIKVLQEHHSALTENIKNAVKHEQAIINDTSSFSVQLVELVSDIKDNKNYCKKVLEDVQNISETLTKTNETSMAAREKQINDILEQLKKDKDNFETEKAETRDLVKLLEGRLKQMTNMMEEESVSLKQKKMEFEFEKATFAKQTEFAKSLLKKQDEEIKMIREDVEREYKEKTEKIEEVKAKALKDAVVAAKEKASIQGLKQEIEKMKSELNAQLDEVADERSKLNLEKQQMHIEEQRILAKSRDLDLLAKSAVEKQSQADHKYQEAEFIQRKYEDRIRRIQEHVVSLNSREKLIAKEKVALSRERLSLHNERKESVNKMKCSLCKNIQNHTNFGYGYGYSMPEPHFEVPVLGDSCEVKVSSAMNEIEREMSHLMGKNLDLKYNMHPMFDVDSIGKYGRTESVDDKYQSVPTESSTMKNFLDPKFMMLRLDVQKVLSNIDQGKKTNSENEGDLPEE